MPRNRGDYSKFFVNVDRRYDEETKQSIASDIIDFVIKRTESGKDKDGRAFPKYSKAYTNSLDFKIAGKSKNVDLRLSGEMLDSLQVANIDTSKIEIGYVNESPLLTGKAEGNIIGSYGQASGNRAKARDFLDISASDLAKILKKYPLNDEESLQAQVAKVKATMDIADKFLKGVFIDTSNLEG